jgi:hypothetical protein
MPLLLRPAVWALLVILHTDALATQSLTPSIRQRSPSDAAAAAQALAARSAAQLPVPSHICLAADLSKLWSISSNDSWEAG